MLASCLCGAIQLKFPDIEGDFVVCHCKSCRKASGSIGGVNVSVKVETLIVEDSQNVMKTYESSPGKVRHFCSRCGSPMFTKVGPKPAYARVRLGSLDSDISQLPAAHIFMAHRASWDQPTQNIETYDEWPDFNKVDIRGTTKTLDNG